NFPGYWPHAPFCKRIRPHWTCGTSGTGRRIINDHPLPQFSHSPSIALENHMISVLIVDDEPLLRAGITLIIESDPNIRVKAEAEHGREALEQLSKHHIDVVLLDIRMPVMDGLETL